MTDDTYAPQLLRKLSGMRSDVHKMDWSKDKSMIFQNKKQYDYLSYEKICRQISAMFEKHGLEFQVSDLELMSEAPVGNMAQHWIVKTMFTVYDVDTGYSISSNSYGEAADSGDKGVNKAKTCAIKRWFLGTFQLVEGGEDPDDASPTPGMSSSEVVKPGDKATPSASAPVKEEPFEPTPPQKKAIDNIVKVWKEKAEKGEVGPEAYNQMSMDCATIKSTKDAVAFITKYKASRWRRSPPPATLSR